MKKFLTITLAAALAASIAGCGAGTSSSSAPASQAPAPAAASEEKAPAEAAPAPAESGESGESGLPAADVAEQGFNYYDKAVGYNDLKKDLGPIPKPEGSITIGFCAKAFENEFWRMEKEGAEAAAKEIQAAGVDLKVDARAAQGESDEQGQLAVLNDMVNKKYNAIMCAPIADGNLLPGVENAMKEGIPMCVVNDAFMPQIRTTVGAWHLEGAELAAQWVNEQIGGEGEVAIIQGLPKNEAARVRTDGFNNYITNNCPNVKVVAIQNADWDRMKAKDIADIWMKQYPDLKAIYANNDTMAMGALEAVKAADRLGKCLVVGCDGTSEALGSVKAGELSATVNNFPYYMSQIGVEMMLRQMGGQEVPKVIYSPQVVIDASNAGKDDAELIGWSGFTFE